MIDARGNTLRLGDLVAFATTTIPGRNTHAVLKIGKIKKIAQGKNSEYVTVEVIEDFHGLPSSRSTPVREAEKLIRLESAK